LPIPRGPLFYPGDTLDVLTSIVDSYCLALRWEGDTCKEREVQLNFATFVYHLYAVNCYTVNPWRFITQQWQTYQAI